MDSFQEAIADVDEDTDWLVQVTNHLNKIQTKLKLYGKSSLAFLEILTV